MIDHHSYAHNLSRCEIKAAFQIYEPSYTGIHFVKGLYGSWKIWKVLEFYYGISQDWKVLEKGHWSWKVLEIC